MANMTQQFHNTLLDSFHIHVYIKANLPPFCCKQWVRKNYEQNQNRKRKRRNNVDFKRKCVLLFWPSDGKTKEEINNILISTHWKISFTPFFFFLIVASQKKNAHGYIHTYLYFLLFMQLIERRTDTMMAILFTNK